MHSIIAAVHQIIFTLWVQLTDCVLFRRLCLQSKGSVFWGPVRNMEHNFICTNVKTLLDYFVNSSLLLLVCFCWCKFNVWEHRRTCYLVQNGFLFTYKTFNLNVIFICFKSMFLRNANVENVHVFLLCLKHLPHWAHFCRSMLSL